MNLDKLRRQLRSPWPWSGPRQRRKAVLALLRDNSLPAIGLLVQEASGAGRVSGEIFSLLRALARLSLAAREALCQLVIQYDHPAALRFILSAGYFPQDPQLRALFYFLTEQWEAYETLDFDGRLLRAAYDSLAPSVRERVAALARRVGRVGWVEAASGGQQGRRLAEMSDVEWKSALLLLFQSRRYDELWQLAQTAPLLWSVRSMELLRRAKWPPSDSPNRDVLVEIANLAARCEGEPPSWGDAVKAQKSIVAHSGRALTLALSPDARTLFSGGSDGMVRLWELPSGRDLGALNGSGDPVTTLALTSDGQFLLTGDLSGRLSLWDVADQRQVSDVDAHQGAVTALRVTPSRRFAVSGGYDGMVFTWSLPDLAVVATHKTGDPSPVAKLALSRDSEWLACSMSRVPFAWVGRLLTDEGSRFMPGSNDAGIAFSHDGRMLAVGNSQVITDNRTDGATLTTAGDIDLWRVGSWSRAATLPRHGEAVLSLLWTPDDRTLISGGRDNYVHLWDMPAGRHRKELFRHSNDVGRMVLDASGRFLLTGGMYQSARLWDLARCELLTPIQGYSNVISDFLLAPETLTLATSDWDGKVVLWQLGPALLRALPLNRIALHDIEWIEAMLHDEALTRAGEAWLRYTLALLHWRHRFDIEVDDAPRRIEAGEFDIEIEG